MFSGEKVTFKHILDINDGEFFEITKNNNFYKFNITKNKLLMDDGKEVELNNEMIYYLYTELNNSTALSKSLLIDKKIYENFKKC